MTSVCLAVTLFTLAALLGVYLLTFVLRGKETRKGVAFMHGPLAAAGLLSLVVASYESGWTAYLGQVALFVGVAVGGLAMIGLDLTGHRVPKWLGAAHGVLAVSGFVWLFRQVLS